MIAAVSPAKKLRQASPPSSLVMGLAKPGLHEQMQEDPATYFDAVEFVV